MYHACAGDPGIISFAAPAELSWPALRVLRIEGFVNLPKCHLDCPSLEVLCIRDLYTLNVPTGINACSGLSVLELVGWPTGQFILDPTLLAAIEGVRNSIEELDISRLGLTALPQWFATLPRLHRLRAADNKLSVLPSLPVSLRALDLQGNLFGEVPRSVEVLTQLTSLTLGSPLDGRRFQIRASLDPIICLLHLQQLVLVRDMPQDDYIEGYYEAGDIWDEQSLGFLGLAQHEIFRSNSSLELRF